MHCEKLIQFEKSLFYDLFERFRTYFIWVEQFLNEDNGVNLVKVNIIKYLKNELI